MRFGFRTRSRERHRQCGRSLLLLDNADTTATGTTIVTDAIAITNSGGSNFTNFLNTPTLDISAAGAITGATGITSSGNITFSSLTAGSVLFAGTSGILQQDNANFFWDDTNNRLGIGDTTPDGRFDFDLASTSTTAANEYGGNYTFTDTGVVTTGTDNTIGESVTVTRTGATGGTISTYGSLITATADTAGAGTSAIIGQYVTASGADTTYGFYANVTGTTSATSYGYLSNVTDATTGANTNYAEALQITDTGVVTAGTDITVGDYITVTRTGATGGTINTYGDEIIITTDNAGAGTSTATGELIDTGTAGTTNADTTYGLYVATEANAGTTAFGIYVDAGIQAGTEYAGIFMNGNVGVGDATPLSLFTVGNGDLFQVNSSGAIAAAAGVTSSGTITFSGLSTAGIVTNTAGGVLGTTTAVAATLGGTGFSSYAVGDLLYANTTTSLAKLADVAAGSCLISGGVGVAPTWGVCGAISADSLDFVDFQDTLDLDANLVLNQTTFTWDQSFTGTTTNGFTYTAASLTSGYAMDLNVNGAAVLTSGGALNIDGPTGAAAQAAGSLFKITTTGAVTGTDGSGNSSQISSATVTGTVSSISDAAVMTTTGDLLTLTANAATTTTGLQTINATGLTTGYAMDLNVNGAAVLTSGGAINIDGPTGAAAQASGALLNITTTGAVTGTAGIGNSLQVTSATVTGTVASITDAATMTTTGNLLTLTGNAATTATGLLTVNANGLTTGSAVNIASTATGLTTGGALQTITHSGSNAANIGSLLSLQNTGTASGNISLLIQHNATGTGNLAFRVNDIAGDTTPVVIDGTGQFGIGTAAPTTLFELYGTGSADAIATLTAPDATFDPILKYRTGATPAVQFSLGIDNTDSDKFKIFSGDGVGSGDEFVIDSNGVTTIANLNLGATTFDSDAGAIVWTDMPVTATTAAATVMSYSAQIDATNLMTMYSESNGTGGIQNTRVGILTTAPLDVLHVAGDVRVGTGTTGCVKDADATVLTGTCSSDERLKKNIIPFDSVLDNLASLTPVTYNWRSDEFPDKHFGEAVQRGLIAQDVQRVFPELVKQDDDGYLQIDFSSIQFYLLQGIKEEYALIQDQSNSIAALSLETTASITTLSELEAAVEGQLILASANFTTLAEKDALIDTKLTEHDTYFARDLARLDAIDALTAQMALDQNAAAANLVTLQTEMTVLTEQVGTLMEFFNTLDLGNMVAKDELGNVDLLGGTLRATALATGGITIEVADEEAPTIGTAMILPVETDADGDGKDDETGSDGKSTSVLTKAMIPMINGSRIFTSFKGNPNAFSWIEKIVTDDGEYVGFKIRVSAPVTEKIKVDWWLIEQKDTFSSNP